MPDDTKIKDKLKAEQEENLAKENARKTTYLAKEQEIALGQATKENQRSEARAKEETREAAKEKARKETYVAREKAISDAHEARKLKENK